MNLSLTLHQNKIVKFCDALEDTKQQNDDHSCHLVPVWFHTNSYEHLSAPSEFIPNVKVTLYHHFLPGHFAFSGRDQGPP